MAPGAKTNPGGIFVCESRILLQELDNVATLFWLIFGKRFKSQQFATSMIPPMRASIGLFPPAGVL